MIGTKIGMVSRQMPIQSIRQPSTIRIAIMIRMTTIGSTPSPIMRVRTKDGPPARL